MSCSCAVRKDGKTTFVRTGSSCAGYKAPPPPPPKCEVKSSNPWATVCCKSCENSGGCFDDNAGVKTTAAQYAQYYKATIEKYTDDKKKSFALQQLNPTSCADVKKNGWLKYDSRYQWGTLKGDGCGSNSPFARLCAKTCGKCKVPTAAQLAAKVKARKNFAATSKARKAAAAVAAKELEVVKECAEVAAQMGQECGLKAAPTAAQLPGMCRDNNCFHFGALYTAKCTKGTKRDSRGGAIHTIFGGCWKYRKTGKQCGLGCKKGWSGATCAVDVRPTAVPFTSTTSAPAAVLKAGSKSRVAFEATFTKSVVACAKATLKLTLPASAVKITSVTKAGRRLLGASVSVKVGYEITMPANMAATALINKSAVQNTVAATATSAIAADTSLQAAVTADVAADKNAADKKAADKKALQGLKAASGAAAVTLSALALATAAIALL